MVTSSIINNVTYLIFIIVTFTNKKEDQDLLSLTENLSSFARKYFDKLIDILPFIEKTKPKDEKSYSALMINPKNKYHSIINQSSDSLLEFVIYLFIH